MSKERRHFPVYLDLRGRLCTVIGNGKHALEKSRSLLECCANLRIAGCREDPDMSSLAEIEEIEWISENACKEEIFSDAFLVVYANSDKEQASEFFKFAEKKRTFFCAVDDPIHCNFIFPAIAKSGPIQVAVSTSGLSPTMATRIKDEIQTNLLTRDMGDLVTFLGWARSELNGKLGNMEFKKKFWGRVIDSSIPDVLRDKGPEAAFQAIMDMHEQETTLADSAGEGI